LSSINLTYAIYFKSLNLLPLCHRTPDLIRATNYERLILLALCDFKVTFCNLSSLKMIFINLSISQYIIFSGTHIDDANEVHACCLGSGFIWENRVTLLAS